MSDSDSDSSELTTESTASELRKTGISVIGDVRWGTHFCYFYETKEDLLETLVLYFKAGLESQEFCVWVISPVLSVEEVKDALGQAVPDLHRHLAEGDLEIHSHQEWYLRNGRWDSQRVLQSWREKLNQGSGNGYAGFRAAGDGGWIQNDDWMAFREYEKQVDAMIADQRSIILCAYPLTTSPGDQVFDVAHIHQVAVARRHGSWEMVETPELKQAKTEIKRLNEELEQRVIERTSELAKTNEELRREITERKLAEAESSSAHQRLSYHVENTPLGVIEWDKGLFIKRWSKRAEEIFGWKAAEALGVNLYDPDFRFVYEEDLPAVNEIAGPLMKGTVNRNLSVNRNYTKDGNVIYCEWYNSVLRDEQGNVITILSLVHDVTERKQAEGQLERHTHLLQTFSRRLFEVQEEERRHLARELHDEIGQALTAAKIILQSVTGNGGSATVARVQETTAILEGLLGQVRQISLDLRPSMLDDLGLVPALRSFIDQQGRRASVEMRFSAETLPESLDATIQTTCFRIAQEAITNALRHAHATGVQIDLRREDENLRLVIRDNGTGFNAESTQAQTAGLGLIGIKERAALLGGQAKIISSPNEGTTIEVFLPLTLGAKPASRGLRQ